jgi:hypothetical protein
MKKLFGIALIGLSLIAFLPRPASAAGPMNFYVREGVLTDQHFSFSPFLWSVGANLDFNLGEALFIAPECDVIVYKFRFNPVWLAPAVTINFRASHFFAGGGVGLFAVLGSGYSLYSDALLKLNAGIKSDTFKFAVYLWTPLSDEAFSEMLFGANIGFGF